MYQNKRFGVIIAAAGSGTRMGGGISKQYREVGGQMILHRSLRAFADHPYIDDIFLVIRKEDMAFCREKLSEWRLPKLRAVISGGAQRQDSIAHALSVVGKYCKALPPVRPGEKPVSAGEWAVDFILVHDGARPFVSYEVICRVAEAAYAYGAAVPGLPVKDTIKRAGGQWLSETLDRSSLFSIQTPQGFAAHLLSKAYQKAKKDGFRGTDDASLVERLPEQVFLTRGDYANIKITTEEDLLVGQAILAGEAGMEPSAPGPSKGPLAPLRIGSGFDVHAFAQGRPLILGGVTIPHEMGLLGHSDADVLTHALMDALLGACGLGDIGLHFPDKDEAYRGVSSLKLLAHTAGLLKAAGYELVNADLTLIAEKPKIAPYISEMKANLAAALSVAEHRINIKGTTTEGLGFCGREEGIAAQAAVLCQDIHNAI